MDPRNPHYFSVGGLDEYARVYDIRNYRWDSTVDGDHPVNKFSPRHLTDSAKVNITGLAYSSKSELLVSYNDELIYLFPKDMDAGQDPQVYSGHRNSQTVKGVSFFGPNDEYVASGSDCGHVFIWKKKGGELVRLMVGDKNIVNCIEPHPHVPFLATSGLEKNIKLWMPIARKAGAALPSNVEEVRPMACVDFMPIMFTDSIMRFADHGAEQAGKRRPPPDNSLPRCHNACPQVAEEAGIGFH